MIVPSGRSGVWAGGRCQNDCHRGKYWKCWNFDAPMTCGNDVRSGLTGNGCRPNSTDMSMVIG